MRKNFTMVHIFFGTIRELKFLFVKRAYSEKKVYTADDIVKNILEFMKKRPNEFEALFNKTAKPANKRSNYPHVSIRKFKI